MHPLPIIIGLIATLVVVILLWTGIPLAWGIVVILVLVIVGLLVGFVAFADRVMRW